MLKKWIRLAATVTVSAAALTFGLTSASGGTAAPSTPVPSPVPSQAVFQPMSKITPDAPPVGPVPQTLFVSVPICRIADTRQAGGPLTSGTFRDFIVVGGSGFTGQGGSSFGCGIPTDATAVSAVVYAVAPTHPGYLSAYPTGSANPGTSILNYPATVTSNGNSIIGLGAGSLRVFNSGGPTQVVVAVNGYYQPQLEGSIKPGSDTSAATLYAGTNRLVGVTRISAGYYQIQWDTNVYYCTPAVMVYSTGNGVYASASDFNGFYTDVHQWYLDPNTHAAVPIDFYFNVSVSC